MTFPKAAGKKTNAPNVECIRVQAIIARVKSE
jgi:hypothetical protein